MRETQVRSLDQEDPLEKGMAIHSGILAWRIPWTEEPGRLQSMGWQRVGYDWSDLAWKLQSRWLSGKESAYQCSRCRRLQLDPWVGKILCRSKWLPTPVFLPGKPHGQRSLVGYSPWDHKESDMTEHAHRSHSHLDHSVSTLAFSSAQDAIPSKCLLSGSVSPFSVLLEPVLWTSFFHIIYPHMIVSCLLWEAL